MLRFCFYTGSRRVDGVKLQPVFMDLLAQVINLPTLESLIVVSRLAI